MLSKLGPVETGTSCGVCLGLHSQLTYLPTYPSSSSACIFRTYRAYSTLFKLLVSSIRKKRRQRRDNFSSLLFRIIFELLAELKNKLVRVPHRQSVNHGGAAEISWWSLQPQSMHKVPLNYESQVAISTDQIASKQWVFSRSNISLWYGQDL